MTADYVGLPFAAHGRTRDGVDCWGLVRLVLAERGVTVPSYDVYADMADHDGIAGAIVHGIGEGWTQVESPEPGDVVLFRIAGQPRHVGVIVARGKFLHAPEGQTSRIERLDDRMWSRRIEGYYRHG